MTDYYVIGDVHGKAGMLEDLLKTWDGQPQLLFLGDLIDRGEDSHRVLEMVKDLVDNQGAICLSGNHEYMFLTWLDDPEDRRWQDWNGWRSCLWWCPSRDCLYRPRNDRTPLYRK